MPSLRGGVIAKGGLYKLYGAYLVSTNPLIRRVNSSYISSAPPTVQVLQLTIYLIRGGGYSEGGAYMPDYTVIYF